MTRPTTRTAEHMPAHSASLADVAKHASTQPVVQLFVSDIMTRCIFHVLGKNLLFAQ